MPNGHESPAVIGRSDRFATTQWSVVLAAGGDQHEDAHRALSQLCETYWYPLYAYVRRRVPDIAEAQDLTQAFFAELLEKDYVAAATPERGRFRAFLITAFKHFLSKHWEKARAQKRGGGRLPISLDFESADSSLSIEPTAGLTAELFYDQQWAVTLLRHILERLESESESAGKAKQFTLLKGFIIGDHEGTTYALVAQALRMTEAAAKQAASRMRRRYRELLREEVAQTVAHAGEVDDEIRNLFAILEL